MITIAKPLILGNLILISGYFWAAVCRYEKDVSNEDPTDRMRQRFRLGFQFDTTENWSRRMRLAASWGKARSEPLCTAAPSRWPSRERKAASS